ncbi:hypothetical protein KP509_14G056900 [Ceratopteris richardii]|uniref:Laccase n=1 Tax=Ceratopteris richardii TaxID=49495 RepID=A0A8T2TA33_CERRI|nr:hypothetical protein KP509_14G056900 [Ceratopteris richardii]KAH7415692.1 hypothetical protein KP509_14G056900 [Ceratopteris richardii]
MAPQLKGPRSASLSLINCMQCLWLWIFLFSSRICLAKTRYFDFTIQETDVTRLCHTKSAVLVNGQYPGPASYVREGDKVVVNVTNLVSYNATIHWHGVRQLLSAWADGPAYVTQCPIQTNQSYVHRFQIVGQRGTLFWHAHFSWLRATVHGAFIILPKKKSLYPFTKTHKELPPLILGEWWNANVEDIIAQALATGGAYNVSDALTINGQPGDLYNCSSDGTFVYKVSRGRTYMLRVINAAVNFQMYFAIANHTLTVVEADAEYTQELITDMILLAPGQTTNVLFTTDQSLGQYYIAASVYSPPNISLVPFPQTPTTAILKYKRADTTTTQLTLPSFPLANDSSLLVNLTKSLKGRSFSEGFYYYGCPENVDLNVLHTVGYALQPCPANQVCLGPNNTIFRSSINNITFVSPPDFSILQAYYDLISANYTTNFPDVPLIQYNYTAVNPINKAALPGTRVRVIPFNTTVQVVYQDTATLFFESHPIHLHGQSFYIVGAGNGTFNPDTDPQNFNLVNPPARNTVSVYPGGWAAVRFRAINPGAWLVHCHFDIHQSWGMDMVFITLNGEGSSQTLPPPPSDLPRC